MKRRLVTSLILSVFVAGCVQDAYTREDKAARAGIGAGVGAGVGAAIGAIVGGNNKRKAALIGAGVGALAGGAVGAYMDSQERALRRRLEADGVRVVREGDTIVLNMRDNVQFPSDEATLDQRDEEILDAVALVLQEYEKTYVDVIGHTDSQGDAAYNRDLSRRRAEAVSAFLEGHGVRGERLVVRGAGEDFPIASNTTPEGRQANRRVEIAISPITES